MWPFFFGLLVYFYVTSIFVPVVIIGSLCMVSKFSYGTVGVFTILLLLGIADFPSCRRMFSTSLIAGSVLT